jgi:hypothetical protein
MLYLSSLTKEQDWKYCPRFYSARPVKPIYNQKPLSLLVFKEIYVGGGIIITKRDAAASTSNECQRNLSQRNLSSYQDDRVTDRSKEMTMHWTHWLPLFIQVQTQHFALAQTRQTLLLTPPELYLQATALAIMYNSMNRRNRPGGSDNVIVDRCIYKQRDDSTPDQS